MDNITIIAAVGKNLELGKNNDLIWHLREDMKFFRDNTMGKPIIMGMNTYKSLPRLLPGRKHIVLTRQNPSLPEEITIIHSIEKLLKYIEEYKEEVMIIGGASLYKQMLEYAKKLLLTEINAEDKEADVFFPKWNHEEWEKEGISIHEENSIQYKHVLYKKKI